MKNIEQKAIRFIDRLNLIAPADRILVALSGGPDSVFLLYFLNKFKRRFKIELAAFHLNHQIRKAAIKDEEFCRNFTKDLEISFFSKRKKVKDFSVKNKISMEEAGRILRYEALEKISKKNIFSKIATAHNADDNAETVILNLIKGSGLKGISGIPPKRGKIIRPVLSIKKTEILDYLNKNKIGYCIDESNQSTEFERNFLRKEVIPLLKKINPSVEESILNSSEVFRNQSQIVERFIEKNANNFAEFSGGKLEIFLDKFPAEDESVGDLLKDLIVRNFSIEIGFNDIQRIISLFKNSRSKRIELSSSIIALREKSKIIIYKNSIRLFEPVELKVDSNIEVGDKILSIENSKTFPLKFGNNNMIEYVDSEGLNGNFILRKWKNGDRFFPLGMKGSKKVSDYLNDRKLSFIEKEKQLVLVYKNEIVWIVGLRLDNRYKIKETTNKVLKLCLK